MKKLFFILIAATTLLFSCANDSSSNSDPKKNDKTLQQLIDETKDGDTLNLSSYTDSKESCIITKKIKIENATLPNTTFIIYTDDITFSKAQIGKIIINEDKTKFITSNSTFETIYIKGNDISINSDSSIFEDIAVFKTVQEISFTGQGKQNSEIKQIISLATSESNLKISINQKFEIKKADTVIINAISSNAENDYKTDDIDTPTITDEEKEKIEEDSQKEEAKNLFYYDNEKYEIIIDAEKNENNYCTKIINPSAKTIFEQNDITKISSITISNTQKFPFKKDSNYEISIDLKADKEGLIRLLTLDFDNYGCNIGRYYNLTTEWQTYTIITGTIPHDWTNGHLCIQNSLISTIYAKNLQYKKLDYDTVGFDPWYSCYEDLDTLKYETNSRDSLTITFEGGSGSDVFPYGELEEGKLYKLSFDVTSNVDFSNEEDEYLSFWIKTANKYVTEGGFVDKLSYSAGEPKNITLYLPATKDPNKTNQTYINSNMWVSASKACKLELSNFHFEKTTFEEIKQTIGMDFYITGIINSWSTFKSDSIILPANKTLKAQYLFSTEELWNKQVITFRKIADKSNKNLVEMIPANEKDSEDSFIVKNLSNKPVKLKFKLADNFDLEISTEELTEIAQTDDGILDYAEITFWKDEMGNKKISYDKTNNYYYCDFENPNGNAGIIFCIDEFPNILGWNGGWNDENDMNDVTLSRTNEIDWKQAVYAGESTFDWYYGIGINGLTYTPHKFRLLFRIDNKAQKKISVGCIIAPDETIPDEDFIPKELTLNLQNGNYNCDPLKYENYVYIFDNDDFDNETNSIVISSISYDGVTYSVPTDSILNDQNILELTKNGSGTISFEKLSEDSVDYLLFINPYTTPMTIKLEINH